MASEERSNDTATSCIFDEATLIGLFPEFELSPAGVKQPHRLQPGAKVFGAGDSPQFIYVLRRGSARLTVGRAEAANICRRPASPGEVFGLTQAVEGVNFSFGCDAVTTCEFDLFEKSDVIRLLKQNPAICLSLLRLLGKLMQKKHIEFFQ